MVHQPYYSTAEAEHRQSQHRRHRQPHSHQTQIAMVAQLLEDRGGSVSSNRQSIPGDTTSSTADSFYGGQHKPQIYPGDNYETRSKSDAAGSSAYGSLDASTTSRSDRFLDLNSNNNNTKPNTPPSFTYPVRQTVEEHPQHNNHHNLHVMEAASDHSLDTTAATGSGPTMYSLEPPSIPGLSRHETIVSGSQLRESYAYCLDRGNGQYTRLIPADALPALSNVPSVQTSHTGMIVLPQPEASAPEGNFGRISWRVSQPPARTNQARFELV